MPTNEFDELRNIIVNGNRSELSVGERVYFDAYRLRLVDVMGNLFPTVKFITDEVFPTLVMEFIKAHPPHHYSVDLIGDTFWQFLKYSAQDFDFGVPNELISDIAQFELAQGICSVQEKEVVSAEFASTGGLEAQTTEHLNDISEPLLLELSYPVHQVIVAVQTKELCAPPSAEKTFYLFYRKDFQVHWQVVDPHSLMR